MYNIALLDNNNIVLNSIVIPQNEIYRFEDYVKELGFNNKCLLCDPTAYRGKNRYTIINVNQKNLINGSIYIIKNLGLDVNWHEIGAENAIVNSEFQYNGNQVFGFGGEVVFSKKNKAFRKNHPSKDYIYDPISDSFLEPKPIEYPSWILDSDGGYWKPPVDKPIGGLNQGMKYQWDESSVSWIQVPL